MKQEDLFNLGKKMKLHDASYARIQAKIRSKKKTTSNRPKAYLKLAISALSYIFCVSFILVIIAGVRTLKEPPLSIGGEVSTSESHSSIVTSICTDESSKIESNIEISQPGESVEESIIEVSQPTEESQPDVSEPNKEPTDWFFEEYGTVENYLKTNPIYEYQHLKKFPIYKHELFTDEQRINRLHEIAKIFDVEIDEVKHLVDFDIYEGKNETTTISIPQFGQFDVGFYFGKHTGKPVTGRPIPKDLIITDNVLIDSAKYYVNLLRSVFDVDIEKCRFEPDAKSSDIIYVYKDKGDILSKYPIYRFLFNSNGTLSKVSNYWYNPIKYGEYEIKTYEEAIDCINNNEAWSPFVGNIFYGYYKSYRIIAWDIKYSFYDKYMPNEFIMPYYVFYLEVFDEDKNSECWFYYIPAIKSEYLTDDMYNKWKGQ